MRGIIDVIVRLVRAGRLIYARKWSFFGLFAVMFFGSVLALGLLNLLPEISPVPVVPLTTTVVNTTVTTVSELPTKITISKIDLDTIIVNPTTTDIKILDVELLKGAVRYPTSAKLGEIGNVVLFGHSSYLPIVHNQAYKAFNDIQKLVTGDIITVYSSNVEYVYKVKSVAKERADDNTAIQLSIDKKILTLVTCNSFGTKEDRFVVTAEFVESHPAGS